VVPAFGLDAKTGGWTDGYARRVTNGFTNSANKQSLLYRMQFVAYAEALNRRDGFAGGVLGREQTGMLALPVNQDGACAALAFAAAVFGTGQPKVLAKQVEQRTLRVGAHRVPLAVAGEGESGVHNLAEFSADLNGSPRKSKVRQTERAKRGTACAWRIDNSRCRARNWSGC
jgi:hypothetical protein